MRALDAERLQAGWANGRSVRKARGTHGRRTGAPSRPTPRPDSITNDMLSGITIGDVEWTPASSPRIGPERAFPAPPRLTKDQFHLPLCSRPAPWEGVPARCPVRRTASYKKYEDPRVQLRPYDGPGRQAGRASHLAGHDRCASVRVPADRVTTSLRTLSFLTNVQVTEAFREPPQDDDRRLLRVSSAV